MLLLLFQTEKKKGDQNLRYNLTIWRGNDDFDVLIDISENITLIQLMESLVHLNHATSIVGRWIFDSVYNKSLHLTQESLDKICSPSIGKELVATF